MLSGVLDTVDLWNCWAFGPLTTTTATNLQGQLLGPFVDPPSVLKDIYPPEIEVTSTVYLGDANNFYLIDRLANWNNTRVTLNISRIEKEKFSLFSARPLFFNLTIVWANSQVEVNATTSSLLIYTTSEVLQLH